MVAAGLYSIRCVRVPVQSTGSGAVGGVEGFFCLLIARALLHGGHLRVGLCPLQIVTGARPWQPRRGRSPADWSCRDGSKKAHVAWSPEQASRYSMADDRHVNQIHAKLPRALVERLTRPFSQFV